MKLKYLFTTLLAGAMFMSGCTEVSLENPLEEVQLSSSYVYIPVEGGEAIISLTATTDWSFNEELIPEWLDVTPTNGSAGTEEVKFSAEEAEDKEKVS